MLVDLARNDVGRVVEFGTCQVDELMTLERYSHVMHLTSQVSGTLAEGRTPIDVLRATLPAGTVSGAPKVRAMEIIDELEPTRRGPYAGIVGYLDFSGSIDTAIAIRTMIVDPPGPDGRRRASVQAGAGVVADSVADDEELETRNKAKALLCAIPAAEAMTAQRAVAVRCDDPGALSDDRRDGGLPGTATDVAAVRVPRDVIRAFGPDSVTFLQGQLSADVGGAGAGGVGLVVAARAPGQARSPGSGCGAATGTTRC